MIIYQVIFVPNTNWVYQEITETNGLNSNRTTDAVSVLLFVKLFVKHRTQKVPYSLSVLSPALRYVCSERATLSEHGIILTH